MMSRKELSALRSKHSYEDGKCSVNSTLRMASEAEQIGFETGLKAAADYLLGTAADFQELVDRASVTDRTLLPREKLLLAVTKEKISLLKGQAGHVRELKQE